MPGCNLPRGTSVTQQHSGRHAVLDWAPCHLVYLLESNLFRQCPVELWRHWHWHHHSLQGNYAGSGVFPQITAENELSCCRLMWPGGVWKECVETGEEAPSGRVHSSKKDNELRTQCAWNCSSLSSMPSNQGLWRRASHPEPMILFPHTALAPCLSFIPPSDCLCVSHKRYSLVWTCCWDCSSALPEPKGRHTITSQTLTIGYRSVCFG